MENKFLKLISSVNFIGIVVILFFLGFCEKPLPMSTFTKETTVIYDTARKTIEVKAPPAVVLTQTIPIPATVDTLIILQAYFTTHHYEQVIADSNIRAYITNTVSENSLMRQKFDYQLLRPIKTVESTTVTIQAKQNGLYLGGFTDYTKGRFTFGPKVSYQNKKNLVIGYDFDALNQGHRVSLQQKIRW